MKEHMYQQRVSLEDGRRQTKTGTVIGPAAEEQVLINKF